MANICDEQRKIHIVLAWIVRAINKILKKGTLRFVFPRLAYCNVGVRTSTKTLKPFFSIVSYPTWFCLVFSWTHTSKRHTEYRKQRNQPKKKTYEVCALVCVFLLHEGIITISEKPYSTYF